MCGLGLGALKRLVPLLRAGTVRLTADPLEVDPLEDDEFSDDELGIDPEYPEDR